MKSQQILDAELLAYLDGEALPEIEVALKTSDALRQRLSQLTIFDKWLFNLFDGIERPLDDDMIDVAIGQATAQQKLIVAAYERDSIRGRNEMKSLRAEANHPHRKLKRLIAELVTQVDNLVSSESLAVSWSRSHNDEKNRYVIKKLSVEIQLDITRPVRGEAWKMIGDIYHRNEDKEPVARVRLLLQSKRGGRARQTFTDTSGYFEFVDITPGDYHLVIELAEQIGEIRDLALREHSSLT